MPISKTYISAQTGAVAAHLAGRAARYTCLLMSPDTSTKVKALEGFPHMQELK